MDLFCKHCGAEIEATEECYGITAPCPGCGENINVPDLNQKQCPVCREIISATEDKCEYCSESIE